jgi:hypothetical protein
MYSLLKAIKASFLTLTFCMALPTVAFSIAGNVSDKPDVQESEKTIHGKVVKVVELDGATHTWDVSVENKETGEVIPLHLDKKTARKVTDTDPVVGDMVVVQYDEDSKHATSFVAVAATSN